MNYYIFKIKFCSGYHTSKVMYGENVEKAITNLDVYIHSDLSTWTTDGDYVITDIKHLCPDKVVKLIEYSDML